MSARVATEGIIVALLTKGADLGAMSLLEGGHESFTPLHYAATHVKLCTQSLWENICRRVEEVLDLQGRDLWEQQAAGGGADLTPSNMLNMAIPEGEEFDLREQRKRGLPQDEGEADADDEEDEDEDDGVYDDDGGESLSEWGAGRLLYGAKRRTLSDISNTVLGDDP